MSFRTIGWFGAECANLSSTVNNMRLYRAGSAPPPNGLPLELAMKIFWEADKITISGQITTENLQTTFSNSVNETVNWGTYRLFGSNIRDFVATAKEMLCFINSKNKLMPSPMFPWHTAFIENKIGGVVPPSDSGRTWSTNYSVIIEPRPYYNPNTGALYAPFSFGLENSGLISGPNGFGVGQLAYSQTSAPPQEKPFVNASLITPWGNAQIETIATQTVVSGSLTITVTAADPATRYS